MSVLSNRASDPPEERAAYAAAIDGLSTDALRSPEATGLILAHDRPSITGYEQDLWAERLHHSDADARQALDMFGVLRAANLRLLDGATPADMARVGVDSERGEESVGYLCRLYAGHDLLHLNQITRIAAARTA